MILRGIFIKAMNTPFPCVILDDVQLIPVSQVIRNNNPKSKAEILFYKLHVLPFLLLAGLKSSWIIQECSSGAFCFYQTEQRAASILHRLPKQVVLPLYVITF